MSLDLSNLSQASEAEIFSWLRAQDDLYENDQPEVDDAIYDPVRRFAMAAFPSNVYFTGVGSEVRGGKIRLPHAMSGLLQVYEGELPKWKQETGCTWFMASDKEDGTSSQIIYSAETGELQIAYSRGNGFEAADITRHISKIPNCPKSIPVTGATNAIRGEVIMREDKFPEFQKRFLKSDGKPYKNPRNAVAGIMNSSSNPEEVYQYLNLVAYTILDWKGGKDEAFSQLVSWGFEIPFNSVWGISDLTEESLIHYLKDRKAASPYALDGIVLDVCTAQERQAAVSRGAALTIKYKVADEENSKVTTIKEVIYKASKDGYLKPRVYFDSIDLVGVTINYATAFNAKYIQDHLVGPGAKIRVTRSGDVIPYIVSVVQPALIAALPDPEEWGPWSWSENSVDAVLVDTTGRKDVQVQKMVDTFTKLEVDNLKQGSLEKLYDSGLKTTESIITASQKTLCQLLGENGNKVYSSLRSRLTNISWPLFAGSLNIMGRGVGRKKLESLYQAFEGSLERMRDLEAIVQVDGFSVKTAVKIVDTVDQIQAFLDQVGSAVTIAPYEKPQAPTGTRMAGQKVVFTGIRSADMEKKIVEEGGEIKSGISAQVTILVCKDPNTGSGKARKARELGIRVMDMREMEKLLYA